MAMNLRLKNIFLILPRPMKNRSMLLPVTQGDPHILEKKLVKKNLVVILSPDPLQNPKSRQQKLRRLECMTMMMTEKVFVKCYHL